MTKPKILVVGKGAKELSMFTLDLADADEALRIAKKMADHTGRNVTVRDADGEVVTTVEAVARS